MFLLAYELKVDYLTLLKYPGHVVQSHWKQLEKMRTEDKHKDAQEKERIVKLKRTLRKR